MLLGWILTVRQTERVVRLCRAARSAHASALPPVERLLALPAADKKVRPARRGSWDCGHGRPGVGLDLPAELFTGSLEVIRA